MLCLFLSLFLRMSCQSYDREKYSGRDILGTNQVRIFSLLRPPLIPEVHRHLRTAPFHSIYHKKSPQHWTLQSIPVDLKIPE